MGETKRQLRWGIIHIFIMVVGILVGAKWGAYGVAVGYTVGICLLTYPSVVFCLKTSPLSIRDFFSTVWRPAFVSVTAAIILYASQSVLSNIANINNTLLNLLFKIIIFTLTYLIFWIISGGKQAISILIKKTFRKSVNS